MQLYAKIWWNLARDDAGEWSEVGQRQVTYYGAADSSSRMVPAPSSVYAGARLLGNRYRRLISLCEDGFQEAVEAERELVKVLRRHLVERSEPAEVLVVDREPEGTTRVPVRVADEPPTGARPGYVYRTTATWYEVVELSPEDERACDALLRQAGV